MNNKLLKNKIKKSGSIFLSFLLISLIWTQNVSTFLHATAVSNSIEQQVAQDVQVQEYIPIELDKNKIAILPKTTEMFYAISDIWHDCFNYQYGRELEEGTYANTYLKNLFTKYDTFVYIHEGRAIAMLMLLPVKLTCTDNSVVDGYYVYAVGTKKEYRNNGITTLMLEYVDEYTSSLGKKFRILNPDDTSPWLYNFYAKRGYELFKYRQVVMKPEELEELAGAAEPMMCQDGLSEQDLYNCRKINLESKTGFVNWEIGELACVQEDYKLPYKNYHEFYFGDWQYAVVRYGRPGTKTLVIKEFYIKEENKQAFFKTLHDAFPDRTFVFQMPDSDEFSNFFDRGYSVHELTMMNFKGAEDLKSKVKLPVYFNFGMD